MRGNEEIRSLLLDITADKNYNACSAEELFRQIRSRLASTPDDEDVLIRDYSKTLELMISTHEICYSERGNLINGAWKGYLTGTVRSNSHGAGFFLADNRYRFRYPEEFYVSAENMYGAMNDDTVVVRFINEGKKKMNKRNHRKDQKEHERLREVSVVQIIKRAHTHVIGTLCQAYSRGKRGCLNYYVEADNRKLTVPIRVLKKDLGGAAVGDKVEVEIKKYPNSVFANAEGVIVHVFGDTLSKGANYDAILREHEVRTTFPEEVLRQADVVASMPIAVGNRLDLRDQLIFTIDGADAKDLDDAISVEKTDKGWILGVHIADVSEYVKENQLLDEEAYQRGTSIYFTDQVIPMLPKSLSNGVCSLNAGMDRYALSAFITLSKDGTILCCECRESIINSKIRGVYSEINDLIEKNNASAYHEKYHMICNGTLEEMLALYRVLETKNRAKGAIEMEGAEPYFVLDENGMPIDVLKRVRGMAECMIEQFMLCANEAVATWLHDIGMPCIYRVHEAPSAEKLQSFIQFAYNMGLDIRPMKKKSVYPRDMQALMNEAVEKELDSVLSTVMLRTLSKARYSGVQGVHFGLATEYYCHFTSPIRRYPDLCIHRIVKKILNSKLDAGNVNDVSAFADRAAVRSTECEIRAMKAERDIEDLYKALYLMDHIGEVYDGVISSVTSFGFFVELENRCSGLVSVSSLDEYCVFDEKNSKLTYAGGAYTIGQRVKVEISHVDIVTREVDMMLVYEDDREDKDLPLWAQEVKKRYD